MNKRNLSITVISTFAFYAICISVVAQSLSRDVYVDVLVNQVGYTPQASKFCMVRGSTGQPFQVIEITSQKVVYEGVLKSSVGDFGSWLTGDFSNLNQEGSFYVVSDSLRSYPFVISSAPYQKAMDLIVNYFSLQRCGPSTTGYLSPCHLDDGKRSDNGKHQDVVGGWHDASDLRKWVSATIYGMIGLSKAYEFEMDEKKRKVILEELKWGNQYFLKMQEPQGYVMDFIGGEIQQAGDNNRWTDNKTGNEGGGLALRSPTAGKSNGKMMIYDSSDDRIIQTDPLNLLGQYNFITAQAFIARFTKPSDKTYSQKSLQAGVNCFEWCMKSDDERDPGTLGAAIQASLEMYKTTRLDFYKQYAILQATELNKLQEKQIVSPRESFGGFFYTSANESEPYKNIWNGCLELIAVCDLIQMFPTHKDVSTWKEIVEMYTHRYLAAFANRNNFNIIPFGLYTKQDPGGNRKIGDYWYRYFMVPENWWVGVNANLASMGIGLTKASKVLNDNQLGALAQRQLDWIVGVNPFNSSTIVSVGYNQPKPFINGNEFRPATPLLPGAVMNGLGGDHNDNPAMGDGHYHVSEYWTPMVAYTLWLMGELK